MIIHTEVQRQYPACFGTWEIEIESTIANVLFQNIWKSSGHTSDLILMLNTIQLEKSLCTTTFSLQRSETLQHTYS